MNQKIVTIVGGTGFVGRYVVRSLAKQGYTIRIISRNPSASLHLKTAGEVGQIVLEKGNLAHPETLTGKLEGSYAIINLVGILFESSGQDFSTIHAQGAERLAKAAKVEGASKFIQISAIGVDHSVKSKYARTKALGEKAVTAAFPDATILRPSVIFGAEDEFFNKFARIASILPTMPLFGSGKTRFQPVYVGDVAEAIARAVVSDAFKGQTFELGGPEILTLKQIYQRVLEYTGIDKPIISVPFSIAGMMAMFSCVTPRTFRITRDQVKLLQYDNIVSNAAKTFAQFGIEPTSPEVIVPNYLSRYHYQAAA